MKNLAKLLADLQVLIDAVDPVLLDERPRCAYFRLKKLVEIWDADFEAMYLSTMHTNSHNTTHFSEE